VFVEVGCKKLVFSCAALALEALRRYYDDPEGVEKEYIERYKWASEPSEPACPAPPSAAERARGSGGRLIGGSHEGLVGGYPGG
jgi:hypothetical protein